MLRVKPQSPCRTLLLESLEIRRLLATDLRADAFQNELLQGLSSLPSIDFPQAILLNIDSRKPSTSDSNAIHDEPPLVPELRDRMRGSDLANGSLASLIENWGVQEKSMSIEESRATNNAAWNDFGSRVDARSGQPISKSRRVEQLKKASLEPQLLQQQLLGSGFSNAVNKVCVPRSLVCVEHFKIAKEVSECDYKWKTPLFTSAYGK